MHPKKCQILNLSFIWAVSLPEGAAIGPADIDQLCQRLCSDMHDGDIPANSDTTATTTPQTET